MNLAISYVNQILAFIVFGAATNLVLGFGGVYAIGPAAFGAVTGYSLVYLTSTAGVPFLLSLLIGVVFAAALGAAIGIAALRLEQLWVILLTLSAQLVVVGIATGSTSLGGAYGLEVTKPFHLFSHSLVAPGSVLPFALACCLLGYGVAWRLGRSPYGRVLRGMRDDVSAAQALGKNIFVNRLSIFVITSGMAGLAGGIITTITQSATPEVFGFNQSVEIIAMVIIGGIGNLAGTVVGATILTLLTPLFIDVLRFNSNIASLAQLAAFGVALVAVVLFRPAGILPEGLLLQRRALRAQATQADRNEPGERRPSIPASVRATVAQQPGYGSESIVRARNLSKSFAGVRAVDELSFELHRGQIAALIGPNGAGKTTVFNLLTGVLPMDGGSVTLKGQDVTGMRPDQIAGLGMVRTFQDVRVFPGMTVLENVMFGVFDQPGEHLGELFVRPGRVRLGEKKVRARALECLEFVGIAGMADQWCSELGYGQQKLVSLARLLATDAEVLLLDEPMAGIDHNALDEILDLVVRVRDLNRTICVVEHSLDVVRRLADHIFFMELGRITAEGSFDELTQDPRLSEVYFGVTS